MAIDTSTGLTAAIVKWLHDQDVALLAHIPDFIKVTEVEFRRRLARPF